MNNETLIVLLLPQFPYKRHVHGLIIFMIHAGLCSSCNNTLLVPEGDQLFCGECRIYTPKEQLEQEMLFVPQGYRPNTECRQHSRDIRISSLMTTLIDRYKVCSRSDLRLLVDEFAKYRSSRRKCRSYEAATAVVFYYQYRAQLQKAIRDFAEENNIDRQEFNRCFIKYSQLKNNHHDNTTDESMEVESEETVLRACEEFLRLIGDELFAGILKKKSLKEEISEAVMVKIQKSLVLEDMLGVPSLVFRALKDLKFKISASSFVSLCKRKGKPLSVPSLLKYQKDTVEYSKCGTLDKATSYEEE